MGFGWGLGRVWEGLLATFLNFFTTFCGFLAIWRNNQNFEAFGRGLGRVLGGSGEGFGMVLGGSGSLLGAVGRSQGCCMLFFVFLSDIFGVVVALSDASAASVARPQGGCWLFFERAKRASEALWCFLWVSMAHCACTALLLSGTFLCLLLLLLWVLLLLLVLLPLVGNFGPLQLHASTTFKNARASRSLLRQVFFYCFLGVVFRCFFGTPFGGQREPQGGPFEALFQTFGVPFWALHFGIVF